MRFIKDSQYYKSILSLGIPVILAQLGQISVGIADNMMIGHIEGGGTQELAAASFANTLFVLSIMFGTGFSYIMTPFVGEALGRKQFENIHKLFANGMFANIIIGIILMIILSILATLMSYMGQPEEIIDMARNYLIILILSVLPMMTFFSFKQYSEGISITRIAMMIMIAANFVNIGFNYLLIYGKFGFPELGLTGAGIGTLIARVFMIVAAIIWFYKNKTLSAYLPKKGQWTISSADIKPFFKLGIASGGQIVMETSVFALSTVMMGWLGTRGLAAHQIAFSISTLGFMIYQGIGSATTIRVSQLKGMHDFKGIKDTLSASIQILLMMVLVISSMFYLTRDWLPSLFTNDIRVISMASSFIIVLAIYQLPDALMLQYGFTLRGLSDVNAPAIITFVSLFAISLSISYLSAFTLGYGEIGIWLGFPIGLTVGSLFLMLRFRHVLRKLETSI